MVMEKALCLLFDGHLSGALWGEAVMTSTDLINITRSAAIDMRSPYLLWHNRRARIIKLRTFGCAVYAWIPKGKRTKLEAHAVKCIFVGYDEEDRSGYRLLRLLDCEVIHSRDVRFNEAEFPRYADRVLAVLPDERQCLCGCHHCEAMDNQALTRTSEVIGASEASAAFGAQRTGASQLEQPIQAGSVQVGETLLPVIIESGDDRTVVPQRAVSPRSGEIARTRTDHPSTWSVEAHTHGTTIGNRSEIQSHNEGHPTSVDASRSQADVHRQPTHSGLVRRLHNDKDSGQMSFLSRERGSCVHSHSNHCNYKYSRPIQHSVCWRQRDNAEYATSTGAGVGECETLCRGCTGRQNDVASMVARTAESGGHNRAYPGRQGNVLKQGSLVVANADKASGRQRRKRKREERLLNERALVDAHRSSLQICLLGRKCPCCYEVEGAVALLARSGVSALEVPSTCSLPSEEDAVLDYLRTSAIESRQDHVKCDRDLPSYMYEQFVYALLVIQYVTEPQIDKQAIASNEAAQWGKAMDSEIQCHEDNETWVLVPRPKGRNKYGIDYTEIFATVVRMEILRLLLALAAAMDWEVEQMDVKTAFLNGYLDEEIYMELPVGYVQRGKEDHVCVLRKSLYGLKQAPRVWYYTFYEVMIAERFTRLVKDHCVFIKTRGNDICIISVYVDDLLVFGTKPFVAGIKEMLKRRFQMTDLGGVSFLLGWHIERRRSEHIIFVHQDKYVTKVLDRFGLVQCRPVRPPDETWQKLSESDCPTTDAEKQEMEKFPYREAVGSFMYLMMGTRPDLANFVRQVSRRLHNPGPHHWNYVVRGLKYLNGTRDYGITFGARDVTNATLAHALSAYSDADYANNVDTCRSVSGYVTYIFGSSPIWWWSSLQKLVTLSTTEAEYVALASTVQEVLYPNQVILELGYDQVDPVRIGEDNEATVRISKNPEHHGRCKHIDIRYFFIQERQQAQDIDVFYCPTDKMPADILTKALTPEVRLFHLAPLPGIFSLWLLPADQTELPSSPRLHWESSKVQHHFTLTPPTTVLIHAKRINSARTATIAFVCLYLSTL
ncbi:unnamed protein product [Phytophthora fragariaefolia]|uniref:Unnamed protein product n=1 Tax=Phytophthora fragariaefolia TaxID=1490495 RepID=A0A9W6X876_9STRA|nr:unnamed protein product [Phytophthora fragariaefolia]